MEPFTKLLFCSGLTCFVLFLVVPQTLCSTLPPPPADVLQRNFSGSKDFWLKHKCAFPSVGEYEANAVYDNHNDDDYLLKPCSSIKKLPEDAEFGLRFCSLFFSLSQEFCLSAEGKSLRPDSLSHDDMNWDVCTVAKQKLERSNKFSFMTQNMTLCKRECVENKTFAPVCQLLIAAVLKYDAMYENAEKFGEVEKDKEGTALPRNESTAPVLKEKNTSAPNKSITAELNETVTPAPTETMTPAPKETIKPGPKETMTPAPKETTTPAPKETMAPVPKETMTPAPKETVKPAQNETMTLAPKETTPAPKETMKPTPKQTMKPGPKETMTPATKETMTPAPKETMTPGPKETMTPAPKKTTPVPKETMTPAPKETMTPAPKETTPVPKETMAPAPKETTPVPKETMTPAPKETMTPAPKETITPASKEKTISAPPGPKDQTLGPEKEDGDDKMNEKQAHLADNKNDTGGASGDGEDAMVFAEKSSPSGHFFIYLVAALAVVFGAYVIYHNRRKIMGYIVEGRQSSHGGQSSHSNRSDIKYKKLKPSVEMLPELDRSITTRNYIY